MSCCKDLIDLGCENFCDDIDLGYTANQDGLHYFLIDFPLGTKQAIEVSLLIGDPIIIPGNTLNETRKNDIQIQQPDGTLYEFDTDVNCVTLRSFYTI